MASMENPDVFTAEPGSRAKETEYVQGLKPLEQKPTPERERLRAYDTMREYVIALDALPEYIRTVTKEMDQMRAAGVPDPAAYEKLKGELAQRYEQFTEVSQGMVDLTHGRTKPGDAVGRMAGLLMQEDRRDELEDAYRAAMEEAEKFGRRKTDQTPGVERGDPLEFSLMKYNEQVVKLMESLIALESNIDLLEKAGRLDDNDRAEFREMLSGAYAQLDDLDQSVGDEVVAASRERKAISDLFNTLKERVRRPEAKAVAANATYVMARNERGTEEESLRTAELLALYEEEVQKLLADAVELEDNVGTFAKEGTLREMRSSIDAAKAEILAKLKKLDGQRPDGGPSRERESLIDVLGKLDERLEKSAPMDKALYDREVRKLYMEALEMHTDITLFAEKGKLDEIRPSIRAAKDAILEKLRTFDARRADGAHSRERELLIQVLAKIDEVLERLAKATAAVSPLAGMRATHRQVKATYASVAHTLTQEQRHAMRSRIAQMSALVRQAEDDAWRDAMGVAPPPPPEPPAPQTDIRSAIVLAISRASEVAGTIAEAVDVRPTPAPKRGLLGALGDAFKLK